MVLYRALALAASTLCAARAALPVRFATVPGTEVLDATWHCVSLMLQARLQVDVGSRAQNHRQGHQQ